MSKATLKREVSLPLLTLYGLGTIVGAGIFVLIGAVAGQAGGAMPVSFMLAAVIAGFTAFSYAELASRLPKSAGEAVYIEAAFHRRTLTASIGYAVVAVGIVSTGAIVRSFNGYLGVFFDFSDALVISATVLTLGFIAAVGIKLSVWVASAITVVSIIGLVLVLTVAWDPIVVWEQPERLMPGSRGYFGVITGAFLAFYAFIGFEDIVNLAEEVKTPKQTIPQAIIISLIVSTVLYVMISFAVVASVSPALLSTSEAPLADVVAAHGYSPKLITAISLIAVTNGALVQIIMASRVLYGMAEKSVAPAWFNTISPLTRTPLNATVVVTLIVLVLSLSFPIVHLASFTSAIALTIFSCINAALIKIKLDHGDVAQAAIYPMFVPITGLSLSLVLLALSFSAWLPG